MTYWEAFTQAKNKKNPDSNEDRLVVVPDRLYAVIDGATDKSGQTYDGLTGGQIAGRVLEDDLRNLASDLDGAGNIALAKFLERVTAKLARRYRALGISQTVRQKPWVRFSAAATIIIRQPDTYRFIIVGDTGLRLNGCETRCGPKPGDVICAQLRAAVHRYVANHSDGAQAANLTARAYTVEGLAEILPQKPGGIGFNDLNALCHEAHSESSKRLPGISASDIDAVLKTGLKGLYRFQNRSGPLGFACFDGTRIPPDLVADFERPVETVESMELFSDGYASLPEGTTVADWEAAYRKLEQDDPERVNSHPDTKGSTPGRFADDRTVLIVRRNLETGY